MTIIPGPPLVKMGAGGAQHAVGGISQLILCMYVYFVDLSPLQISRANETNC